MWRFLKYGPAPAVTLANRPLPQVSPENGRIVVVIELGRLAADMAVGRHQVEMTVEVQVGQDHSPAGQRAAIDGQAGLASLVLVQNTACWPRARARGLCAHRRSD